MYPPVDAPDLDRDVLVRVEQADHPEAIARGLSSSILAGPPSDGAAWSPAFVPFVDEVDPRLPGALNLGPAHARGARGAGVKVAIFDLQWQGAESLDAVAMHDCWQHPSCAPALDPLRPNFDFERGVHGTACADVVRAVAPEAELFLVRVNTAAMFEAAAAWAIREEIDIISMSMSFFTTSFFDNTGPLAAPVRALDRHGVLLVTSAGNYARGHWRGLFVDADGDGRLDFDGSNALPIYLRPSSPRVFVTWDQFASCGMTDLDAELRDARGFIVARGTDEQRRALPDEEGHRCRPAELLASVPEEGWYDLQVFHRRGVRTGLRVDVVAPGGTVEDPDPFGSIQDPGNHPTALTVGAIDLHAYLTARPQGYSSLGERGLGFKPDIYGPDAIGTRTLGPRGFFGTSAATPAVAGLIAVLMSEHPGLTPQAASERLQAMSFVEIRDLLAADPVPRARLPDEPARPSCGERPLWLGMLPLLGWWVAAGWWSRSRGRRRR